MKLAVFSAIIVASGFSLAAYADAEANTYRSEINLGYGESDSDFDSSDDYSVILQGTQYFSSVDTTTGPLAEAAFLQKASSFSLWLANSDYESDWMEGDSYLRRASVTYFIPDSIFFVGAGVQEYKYSASYASGIIEGYEGKFSTDWKSQLDATVGIVPLDGLQVWSKFSDEATVSESWNLNARYVRLLVGERALAIGTSYTDDNKYDERSVNINAEYYFTPSLSVGVGLARSILENSDNDDEDSFSARVRQFITQNASIELNYASSDSSDSWTIGGTVRF